MASTWTCRRCSCAQSRALQGQLLSCTWEQTLVGLDRGLALGLSDEDMVDFVYRVEKYCRICSKQTRVCRKEIAKLFLIHFEFLLMFD